MKLSQTFYSIELLFPLNLDSDEDKNSKKEPEFITLCNLDYNSCISIGEEINIPKWSLGYANTRRGEWRSLEEIINHFSL
jgi:hypothetical protein